MTRVELIYDLDCPNVGQAREALLRAFAEAGIPASWQEWDRKSPESPAYVRRYGSPTVLVNGQDVAGAETTESADSCRVYGHDSDGLRGVPPVARIVASLRSDGPAAQAKPMRKTAWVRQSLGTLPGIGAAVLPVGACPACWPVYAGVLGALGMTFLLQASYLLWISAALMVVALFALAYRAGARQGYGPLVLGAASAGAILFFKFASTLDWPVYAGLLGLVAASVWNAWPKKNLSAGPCPQCEAGPIRQAPNTP